MFNLANYPFVFFLLSLLVLWTTARIGVALPRRSADFEGGREDFSVVLGAALTLLGLIIGFTFSMAIARYDQRKNLEEEEANAIGTEYSRADLLPPAAAEKVRGLLRQYLDDRIAFYNVPNIRMDQLAGLRSTADQLDTRLWAAVVDPARAQGSPVVALAVSGMNDVLNSRGYTQAAWWNRIPAPAWLLMASIAVLSNLLVGYGARRPRTVLLLIVPLLVSLSFLLIADIDSPRGGIIRVAPRNLLSLAASLHGG